FCALTLVMLADTVPLMLLGNALWGSAAGATNISQQIMWASYFGRGHQGAIRGIVQPLTVTIGSLSGPLVGSLHEVTGTYATGWSRLIVPRSTALPELSRKTLGRIAMALLRSWTGPAATVRYWLVGAPSSLNRPASSVRVARPVPWIATSTAPAGMTLGVGR